MSFAVAASLFSERLPAGGVAKRGNETALGLVAHSAVVLPNPGIAPSHQSYLLVVKQGA